MVALISLRALDRSSPTKGLTHRKRPERTMRDPEHKTDISRQYALCGLALMQTNNCSSNAGMKTSSSARLSPCQISDVLKPFFLRSVISYKQLIPKGYPAPPIFLAQIADSRLQGPSMRPTNQGVGGIFMDPNPTNHPQGFSSNSSWNPPYRFSQFFWPVLSLGLIVRSSVSGHPLENVITLSLWVFFLCR